MGKSDALSRRADHGSGSDDNRDITLLTPKFFAARALEGVEVEGQERELLKLIRKETQDGKLEDAVSESPEVDFCKIHTLFRMVGSRRSTLLPRQNLCPPLF